MSGHSKWSTIKRQKGIADARRSAMFTKLARQISIAARAGADIEMNFKLRLAVDRAKAANLPNDNIERAIKAGSGQDKGDMKEALYEGFGPGGVAVMVQALTDNANRTSAEIRSLFSRHGGSLGSSNSVSWMFQLRGVLHIPLSALGSHTKDELELGLIDAGAEDVTEHDQVLMVQTTPEQLAAVKTWLTTQGVTPDEADVEYVPQTTVAIDPAQRTSLTTLLEALDDHPDVTNIYTNDQ